MYLIEAIFVTFLQRLTYTKFNYLKSNPHQAAEPSDPVVTRHNLVGLIDLAKGVVGIIWAFADYFGYDLASIWKGH